MNFMNALNSNIEFTIFLIGLCMLSNAFLIYIVLQLYIKGITIKQDYCIIIFAFMPIVNTAIVLTFLALTIEEIIKFAIISNNFKFKNNTWIKNCTR